MTLSKKAKGRTVRHRRIRSRIHGTASRPRLCVFRSNRAIYAQLIDDVSATVLASASNLKKKQDAPAVGQELAKTAATKKITACVFDRNGYQYHGTVKALADGARAGGLKF